MATGYPYVNVPLDKDKKEIRVLSCAAQRRISDGPLKFSFKTISLQANPTPTYNAVSYVWGSSDIRKEIIIDGHIVSVPYNTEEALRRLCRHKQNSRIHRIFSSPKDEIVLWIDAVCINQAHVSERSWQVAMMGLVYSSAAEVLIWLGCGGDGEKKSIAVVKKLVEHCKHETGGFEGLSDRLLGMENEAGERHRQNGDIFRSARRPGLKIRRSQGSRLPLTDAEIQSCMKFFSAPWFTRLWAAQEVVLAKSSVCCFGERSIPAWDVLMAAVWVSYGSNFLISSGYDHVRGVECAMMIYTMSLNPRLGEILQCVRDFDCTELRDKVYAILHLMSVEDREEAGGYAPIEPDYSKSLKTVWTDATRAATLEASDLCLLRDAGLRMRPPDKLLDRESFPSWVPHYDRNTDQGRYQSVLHDYSWYRGSLETNEELEDRDVLSVKGTTLGRVTQVGARYTETSKWSDTRAHLRHELASTWLSVQSSLALRRGESMTSAVGAVFTCGMKSSWLNANEEQFNESVRTLILPLKGNPTSAERAASDVVTDQEMPFLDAFDDFSKHRVLFIAESGRVGMAPAGTQDGDTIVQLFGSEIPFILRQEGEYWKLLGDVYFHHLPDVSSKELVALFQASLTFS